MHLHTSRYLYSSKHYRFRFRCLHLHTSRYLYSSKPVIHHIIQYTIQIYIELNIYLYNMHITLLAYLIYIILRLRFANILTLSKCLSLIIYILFSWFAVIPIIGIKTHHRKYGVILSYVIMEVQTS